MVLFSKGCTVDNFAKMKGPDLHQICSLHIKVGGRLVDKFRELSNFLERAGCQARGVLPFPSARGVQKHRSEYSENLHT